LNLTKSKDPNAAEQLQKLKDERIQLVDEYHKASEKDIKRVIVASIILLFILLANIQIFNNLNVSDLNPIQNTLLADIERPISSDSYLEDYYLTGSGVQQDVRIFGTNSSLSLNNENNFEIPGMSTVDTSYLSQGYFNFTFQNNYTTDYVLENTGALYTTDFIKFIYNQGASTLNVHTGTNVDPITDLTPLVDNNPNTYIRFTPISGILNFTINSSFAGTSFSRINPTINLNFNRNYILGLISNYQFSLTKSAYLTLRAYDNINSVWINLTESILFNSSISIHTIENRFINENLKYINLASVSNIQFFFQGLDITSYTLTLREFKLTSTYAFDLPINTNNYVALEFDLKGESSTVNGFYAWIRTVNLTGAQNTELNITLYQADSTIARTAANLATLNLKPDTSKQIDSLLLKYSDYHGDNLTYFSFNNVNTQDLPLYNYFVVIKSNQSSSYHSLVTIPQFTFGDPDAIVDHQLRTTLNNGTSWNVATKVVTGTYTSEILDAASFKVNVTRGYMPSDFINPYNSSDTLKIQNFPLENRVINSAPYNQSSSLTWGLGTWNYNFSTPITSTPPSNFQISLNWNTTIIKGFLFNVSYDAKAYWIEKANSFYNVSYDTTPQWELNFTLNLNNANLDNWEFTEYWFVYPNDYSAMNLTNPNYVDIYGAIFNATGRDNTLPDNTTFEYTNVPKVIIDGISGQYSLKLNSSNLIHQMHSYINYNDILWETNGFMYGDNISVRLDIRDRIDNPGFGGTANVVLFYPNNETKYPGAELNSAVSIIKESSLVFEFSNFSILDVTEDVPLLGNFYLGFFWENGSAVGCKKLKLYIDTYDVNLNNCFYEPSLDENVLEGIINKVYNNYSILIATVNVTSGAYDPNFFAINNSNLNQDYIYQLGSQQIPIRINSFLQNETLLNPEEDVNITLQIQNLHPFVDINVKVEMQLVSLLNDEWIIDEETSALELIKPSIDPNGEHKKEFSTILKIPTLQTDGVWQGINAPIRKGGVKVKAIIYFEYGGQSYEAATYESNDYSLLINSTQDVFDGYILALKYDKTITGASLLKPFNRNECQYLPDQTTFVVNIFDKNYVSSYEEFITSFSLKLNSQFSNITATPETPIYGQSFNITSDLTTEFGVAIPNENVTLQYYNGTKWDNLSTMISNINGTTDFEINTLSLLREEFYTFRFTWEGDLYRNSKFQNFTVYPFRASNNMTITIQSAVVQIFKNLKAGIQVTLHNIGDSDLVLDNISVLTNPFSQPVIVEINNLKLERFSPGDSTVIIIEITAPAVQQVSITISIDSYNPQTQEFNNFQESILFNVYDPPLEMLISQYFILIMIGIFIIVWAIGFIFRRRMIKKIEIPFEEPSKKRPRRGKYVPVSEIPREGVLEEKREDEIKKEPEDEQKKDLDSLLEEEGL
ncbi:MAG: hypothetical protein ACFFKA_05200, partial [Candidatus Thorarchaeota archaeon]